MATQISLERRGVVLLNPRHGRTALGPKLRRDPHHATDCRSDTPLVRLGENTLMLLITNNRFALYTEMPKRCHAKNIRANENSKDIYCIQETHLKKNICYSSEVLSSTDMTVRSDQKVEY